jgi:hypothetical protein
VHCDVGGHLHLSLPQSLLPQLWCSKTLSICGAQRYTKCLASLAEKKVSHCRLAPDCSRSTTAGGVTPIAASSPTGTEVSAMVSSPMGVGPLQYVGGAALRLGGQSTCWGSEG